MKTPKPWQCIFRLILLFVLISFSRPASAAPQGILRGRVIDPLGAVVPGAKVALLENSKEIAHTQAGPEGAFEFAGLNAGRYSVRVQASGFENEESAPAFVPGEGTAQLDVIVRLGSLRQQMVVSSTGTAMPESQVGASVSVVDQRQLDDANHQDVSDELRTVPGAQVVRGGRMGSVTSLFIRGGESNFNKVLIDGIPANDIGGYMNLGTVAAAGVDEAEILRGPNSALYGSDGLASVINLTTRRGTTGTPEITYAADGGNFSTMRHDGSIGGAYHAFDYFSEFARFDTRNGIPNNSFHNGTYAGNLGWAANATTELRLTVRHSAAKSGDPNATAFYGIPDDSWEQARDTYVGVTAQNQTTPRWHNLARFAYADQHYSLTNPSPTGTLDLFGDYVGNTVTICGANGYCTTGSAILDCGLAYCAYPSTYQTSAMRRSIYAQSDYQARPDLGVTGGFRYEHENGSGETRDNFSGILEGRGSLKRRLYVTAGVGLDQNAVFGFAATPRVSLAYYLRRPSTDGFFSDTKLKFNFATGIKEPNTYQQASSLYQVLLQSPGGPALISQYGISPVGAERSRSFDFGAEQGFWNNRARLGVTLFHARYYDLIEYVGHDALPLLGVPPSVALAAGWGAYINSDSHRAFGAELEVKANIGHGLFVRGNYTYLDAVVTRSFTSDALGPSYNPAFPTIPIGVYSPLVGARPFNRAPHSGSLVVDYARRKFGVALSGSFVGRRDGSTYLTDAFYWTTMLLPNRNLQAGYQVVDLSGRYIVNAHVTTYVSVSNLFSQHYQAEIGYPSLPLAFRAGMKFTFGGESGWWK
ncbi:MAG: TonB-dependent receptor [Acidobacteriia bacterium]|nr:TonB-dependent receptor [Terriglobia bacterium]